MRDEEKPLLSDFLEELNVRNNGTYLNKHISQKIVKIAGIAEELAIGNIDVEVEAESKDEVGQLANSFSKMIDGINKKRISGSGYPF